PAGLRTFPSAAATATASRTRSSRTTSTARTKPRRRAARLAYGGTDRAAATTSRSTSSPRAPRSTASAAWRTHTSSKLPRWIRRKAKDAGGLVHEPSYRSNDATVRMLCGLTLRWKHLNNCNNGQGAFKDQYLVTEVFDVPLTCLPCLAR